MQKLYSIKKQYIFILFLLFFYISFMIYRYSLGYLTPDEKLFISGRIFSELQFSNAAFKYKVVSKIFQPLYNINIYLLPIMNIIINIVLFKFLYKKYRDSIIKKRYFIFLFFLMPTTIFLTVAYLRDIYVTIFLMLFIFSYTFWQKIILIVLAGILRPEMIFLLILSWSLSILQKSKYIFILAFVSTYIIIYICIFHTEIYNIYVYHVLSLDSSKYDFGLGLLHFNISRDNAFLAIITNQILVFFPYFTLLPSKPLEFFYFIDSILYFILILFAIRRFSLKKFRKYQLYRLALYFTFFGSIAIGMYQTVPSSAVRYKVLLLPFLMVLAGMINFKNLEKLLGNK